MSISIVYAILVTSLATFLSRILGALSSERIKETSKIFKWFNCLAYATLAALIARTIIFPVGVGFISLGPTGAAGLTITTGSLLVL